MKIIFIGTPQFAATVLEKLAENSYKPVLAVTAPDKPAGRKKALTPPPVKILAEKLGIKIEQPGKIKELKSKIENLKPDLIILAAYGQIISKDILDIPNLGAINIHPSLLPKYRGASPIQTAILNGDKQTGVTIYFMDEKMDHGPIISSASYQIPEKTSYTELCNDLASLGADLLLEALPKIETGQLNAKPQDELQSSYTKIIKKEDGRIDWKKSSAEIERQIRAYSAWPSSFFLWEKSGKNLSVKILKAEARELPDDKKYAIGEVVASLSNEILIVCGSNFLLIEELQLEGKKPVKSSDFLKGHPDFIGTILK